VHEPTCYTRRMTYRLVRGLVALAVAALVPVAGCGRSDVGQYVWDSGLPDAHDGGACDATTCPTGCCDPSGTCRQGTELNACGFGGGTCDDCQQQGFDFCDSQAHACGNLQPTCDVTTCPTGCCTLFNGQLACVSGLSSLACGSGGQKCSDCTQNGQLCDVNKHACVNAPCGPNNCKGCCAGDVCVGGQSDAQCGTGGLACSDCAAQNQFCNGSTGQCQSIQPLCDATNCKGCCAGDVCVTSETDAQCGLGGKACTDCTTTGSTCNAGTCVSTCNAQTCPGCCQAGTCFAGFVDSRCGSGGAACADCTAQNAACDTLATPRTCSTQSTCPTSYGGCPSTTTTIPPQVTPNQCTASDLQDAKAACSLGFDASCQSFFQTEQQINPSCAKCLTPFATPLQAGTGVFACVAPYVGASCNHSTGCATDCLTKSCSSCPANLVGQCDNQVQQGQCLSYYQGVTCVGSALFNQASFCNPQQYNGNYGAWLAGVGAHYCQ
jgi:hypothetical protein